MPVANFLIRRNGGWIQTKSEGDDAGIIFSVSVPICQCARERVGPDDVGSSAHASDVRMNSWSLPQFASAQREATTFKQTARSEEEVLMVGDLESVGPLTWPARLPGRMSAVSDERDNTGLDRANKERLFPDSPLLFMGQFDEGQRHSATVACQHDRTNGSDKGRSTNCEGTKSQAADLMTRLCIDVGAAKVGLFVFNDVKKMLQGIAPPALDGRVFDPSLGSIGRSFRTGEAVHGIPPLSIIDSCDPFGSTAFEPNEGQSKVDTLLCVPVVDDLGVSMAVVYAINKHPTGSCYDGQPCAIFTPGDEEAIRKVMFELREIVCEYTSSLVTCDVVTSKIASGNVFKRNEVALTSSLLKSHKKIASRKDHRSTDVEQFLKGRADSVATPVPLSSPVNSALRFLVVDDAKSERKMLRHMFGTGLGCQVDEACNGAEAVEMVEKSMISLTPYDCVIMDCTMPVMDGPRAASEMKAIGFRGVLVGFTGLDIRDTDAFVLNGVAMVLEKPLTKHVVKQIAQLVDTQVRLRHHNHRIGPESSDTVPPLITLNPIAFNTPLHR